MSKVYTNLKFKQFDWLKKYIDLNTDKSKNAASSFKKNFKLIVNSIYGQIMGNLGKILNFRLVSDAKNYKKIWKYTNFCFTGNI